MKITPIARPECKKNETRHVKISVYRGNDRAPAYAGRCTIGSRLHIAGIYAHRQPVHGSGTAYGSAGTIEYADKENQRNPVNDNRHVTEQGIRYRQYTPINGIPAGETCSVQSARCPDRSDCSGTRNAGRHLFDQEGRSLSRFLPDSLFSRRSGIPDGIFLA